MWHTRPRRRSVLPNLRQQIKSLGSRSNELSSGYQGTRRTVILGTPYIIPVYFIYGLAFFSMGLLVAIEGGRASDMRLRRALPPLAGFGFVHAAHEWLEMYVLMGHPTHWELSIMWGIQLATLAFSFISLAAFGSFLLADTEVARRLLLLIPIGLQAIWVFGLYNFRGQYAGQILWDVADTWTRYTLAIPASIL